MLNRNGRHHKYFSHDMWCGSQRRDFPANAAIAKKIIKLFQLCNKLRSMIAFIDIISRERIERSEQKQREYRTSPDIRFDILFMARWLWKAIHAWKLTRSGSKKVELTELLKAFNGNRKMNMKINPERRLCLAKTFLHVAPAVPGSFSWKKPEKSKIDESCEWIANRQMQIQLEPI